jgi:hypothetical protein
MGMSLMGERTDGPFVRWQQESTVRAPEETADRIVQHRHGHGIGRAHQPCSGSMGETNHLALVHVGAVSRCNRAASWRR